MYKTPKHYLAAVRRHNKKPEKRHPYKCYGGPYDQKQLMLVDGHTLTFSVNGYHGHYHGGMSHLKWVDKK